MFSTAGSNSGRPGYEIRPENSAFPRFRQSEEEINMTDSQSITTASFLVISNSSFIAILSFDDIRPAAEKACLNKSNKLYSDLRHMLFVSLKTILVTSEFKVTPFRILKALPMKFLHKSGEAWNVSQTTGMP
jgi:hypothetical protein